MKKIILTAFLLSSVSFVSAYADIKMDMLSDKVTRLEKDINALNRKIYQSTPSNITESVSEQDGLTGNLEDLYNRVSAQDAVVKDLTAKMEQLEFQQKQLDERLNKMNADIDVRFNMLQNEKSTVTSSKEKEAANKEVAQKAYDNAYNIMKKGDYKAAEGAFTTFMKDYPKSSLIGNANYWLGETYYARGLYEQAVGIFADGFTKYKKNSKAADNLLKLGLTMNKLNKKTEACTAFKSLATEFPKADKKLKDRATAEAKKLSCK
ncbi:MAG: tol-pal system protein YbgF [Alphaproteobacteria bacterium]|nr:tol-pal system protein YbgF [Alphaproteobacteria bacterium]